MLTLLIVIGLFSQIQGQNNQGQNGSNQGNNNQGNNNQGNNNQGASSPNFIIFIADDLGYSDIGVMGSATIRTPNLDRLFNEGARLNSHYSHPLCSPSRSAFLTGRLPVRSGIYTNYTYPLDGRYRVFYPTSTGCLPADEKTIPQYLKQANPNYYTLMMGKWHLGHKSVSGSSCLPTTRGFDEWLGLPYSHEEGWPTEILGDQWPPIPLYEGNSIIEQPANFSNLVPRYNSRILSRLDTLKHNKKPFFIHYAFDQPHFPTFTSPQFTGKSIRGPYGDAVEEIDYSVGLILDKLKQTKLDKNTLIFFASDNGGWLIPGIGLPGLPVYPLEGGYNGFLREGKGSTFEGGTRVLAAFYWPKKILPSITMSITSVHDILPTVLDFAHIPLPNNRIFDGHSLVPLLTGINKTSPYTFYYYYRESVLMAIRFGSYKCNFYTRSGFEGDPPVYHNPCQLYNMDWNPAENIELNTTEYPDILNTLNQEYTKQVNNVVFGYPQYNDQLTTYMPCCHGVVTDQGINDSHNLGLTGFAMWQHLGCVC